MLNLKKTKKRLIISFKNLNDDLRILFRDTYPDGYKEYIQKAYKPDGEPLFVVPLETEDTSYLIKFDVKVDTLHAEDIEKEMFDIDDKAGDDDFTPMADEMDKDDDMSGNHTERVLNHGSYDSLMDEMTSDGKKKKAANNFDDIRNELKEEFGSDDDDVDEYRDSYTDDGDDDDEEEPTAEDLAEIDEEFLSDIDEPKSAKGGKKGTKKAAAEKSATKTKKSAADKKPAAKKTATKKK